MIEEDFKKIVEAFKENLFFYERLPDPKDLFPAINFFVRESEEQYDGDRVTSRIRFEARIYAPWPASCEKFDDVLLYTMKDVYAYKQMLRTFIRHLNRRFKYGILNTDRFVYTVFPYQVTEHNYIAVKVIGAVYENGVTDCCSDERFDLDALPNSKLWGG